MRGTFLCVLLTAGCGDGGVEPVGLSQLAPTPIVIPALPHQTTINIVIRPIYLPDEQRN